MQRRSTARSTPRKRYTVDAFEGVPELEGVAQEDGAPDPGAATDDSEADATNLDPESEDDELQSLDEDEEAADDSANDPTDDVAREPAHGGIIAQTVRKFDSGAFDEVPGIKQAKRKWASNLTLPTRQANNKGKGGFHYSFSLSDAAVEEESRNRWSLDSERDGKERFAQQQYFEPISAEEAAQYLGPQEPRSFVMGPCAHQKLFRLRCGQSAALFEAWPSDAVPASASSTSSSKPGFVFNLGAKVRCLRWIPGRNGRVQYLSTSTLPTHISVSQEVDSTSVDLAPIHESTICIWRLMADGHGRIDSNTKPVPKLILCTTWGTISSLDWRQQEQDDPSTLGLLAFLANDGILRVLDVPLPGDDDIVTKLQIKEAAHSLQLADTACTSFTWLSQTRIAVGCADGSAR
ncbi:hypothetical protein LTR53_009973, partial [Teratosphaeriaceae sp. CCFEE 6253]